MAEKISEVDSPYIAVGDVVGEKFRKAVTSKVVSNATIHFRSTLGLNEGNGDHTWLALYRNATDELESGVKVGQIAGVFSKNASQVLNAEYKLTLQQGG